MTSYKFNGRDINLKGFSAVHEFISDISLIRVVLSVRVICNKNDKRYPIRYKTVDSVFLLFVINSQKTVV